MTVLKIVVDPGSTSTKVACGIGDKEVVFVMLPHVVEIDSQLAKDLHGDPIAPPSESNSFVKHKGKFFAVGQLAQSQNAYLSHKALKAETIPIKCLAAVSIAIAKLKITGDINEIVLSFLLPPAEYRDRGSVIDSLKPALKKVQGIHGSTSIRNCTIRPSPEGYGVYQFLRASRNLGESATIIMAGDRNISLYTVLNGEIVRQKSTDQAFSVWVEAIIDRTSGYYRLREQLSESVAEYIAADTGDTKRLCSLLQRRQEEEQEEELKALLSAVDSTRVVYWRSLSQWLTDNFDRQSNRVFLAGGMGTAFASEFSAFFAKNYRDEEKHVFFYGDFFPVPKHKLAGVPLKYHHRLIDALCAYSALPEPTATNK